MKSFKILFLFFLLCGHLSNAQSATGELEVKGEAGPSQLFQQVKAVRCDREFKKCSQFYFFNLNQSQKVEVGQYIVGFENSLYPGWVKVQAGQKTTLNLVKLATPSELSGQSRIRVFRDLDADIEKNKIYFTQLHFGRPFFRLSQWSFGDLYLTKPGMLDITVRLNYDVCNRSQYEDPEVEDAKVICENATRARNSQNWRNMSSLFQFSGKDHMQRSLLKGQYVQKLVSEAGDTRHILMRRQLVSGLIKGGDFVSVFPGRYRFLSDQPDASSISLSAGPQTQYFD
jgi:hypothetical protein